jgi:acyl-CoA synthetase (AMP-forming)/AMP-acid ligase II
VWAGDVKQAIRGSLAAEHGVRVDEIALLKVGSLSFTTSGKLQRSECRSRYLSGALRSAVDADPRRSPA